MKAPALVKALEEAHLQLGVPVRRERGPFRGGRCTVEGDDVMVINKMHPAEAQVVVLAESLRSLPHDQLYIRPSVRTALEGAWAARHVAMLDALDFGEE